MFWSSIISRMILKVSISLGISLRLLIYGMGGVVFGGKCVWVLCLVVVIMLVSVGVVWCIVNYLMLVSFRLVGELILILVCEVLWVILLIMYMVLFFRVFSGKLNLLWLVLVMWVEKVWCGKVLFMYRKVGWFLEFLV